MASFHSLIAILAIVAISLNISPILATDYMVGDDIGWKLNFNYQEWAQGKEFRVGDRLVFKYPEGAHNVLEVDGAAFRQCAAPSTVEASVSGEDFVTLTTPGRKWYICGVGKHCESGNMKFVITVLSDGTESLPPAATPGSNSPSSAAKIGISKYYALFIGALGFLLMVVV